MEHFSKQLRRNSTRLFEKSFERGDNVENGEYVALSNQISVEGSAIYRQPFSSKSTLYVELVEARFESDVSAASLKKATIKEEHVSEV